jgi:hypothetical protein
MFVLQLQIGSVSADSFLGWYDPASMLWVNAVQGNFGGTNFFAGDHAYQPATDFSLGTWGVDTAGGTVWAVLNHNSDFAVTGTAAVPESGSGMLLFVGVTAVLGIRCACRHRRPFMAVV